MYANRLHPVGRMLRCVLTNLSKIKHIQNNKQVLLSVLNVVENEYYIDSLTSSGHLTQSGSCSVI